MDQIEITKSQIWKFSRFTHSKISAEIYLLPLRLFIIAEFASVPTQV
jgi:hypothetical protein